MTPTTRAVKLGANKPASKGVFVAPNATLVGRVKIGPFSSVWYSAILRGDVSTISVGSFTSIGDRTMIHCSSHPKELPTTIGDNVVVESGCILHGCTLANGSLVGEGSQVMDGASLGEGAALLPGSLLPMGKTVPAGQLWGGSPATFQRQMTPNEIAAIASLAQENAELAVFHARETEKGWEEIEFDEFEWGEVFYRSPHWFQRKRNATLTTYDGPGAIAKTDCKPPSLLLF